MERARPDALDTGGDAAACAARLLPCAERGDEHAPGSMSPLRPSYDALGQHSGLACPRSRADDQPTVRCLDRLKLLGSESRGPECVVTVPPERQPTDRSDDDRIRGFGRPGRMAVGSLTGCSGLPRRRRVRRLDGEGPTRVVAPARLAPHTRGLLDGGGRPGGPRGCAAVSLDLPGFGATPAPPKAMGAWGYAEVLAPLIEQMRAKSAPPSSSATPSGAGSPPASLRGTLSSSPGP